MTSPCGPPYWEEATAERSDHQEEGVRAVGPRAEFHVSPTAWELSFWKANVSLAEWPRQMG